MNFPEDRSIYLDAAILGRALAKAERCHGEMLDSLKVPQSLYLPEIYGPSLRSSGDLVSVIHDEFAHPTAGAAAGIVCVAEL